MSIESEPMGGQVGGLGFINVGQFTSIEIKNQDCRGNNHDGPEYG